jgi:hypothetical protein
MGLLLFSSGSPSFGIFSGMEDSFYEYRIVYFIHSIMCTIRKRRDGKQSDIIVPNLVVQGRLFECGQGIFGIIYESMAKLVALGLLGVEINGFLHV